MIAYYHQKTIWCFITHPFHPILSTLIHLYTFIHLRPCLSVFHQIVIHFHPSQLLLSIFNYPYPFSSNLIHFHPMLPIFIQFYPQSSIFIHFIHFYWFASTIINFHSFYRSGRFGLLAARSKIFQFRTFVVYLVAIRAKGSSSIIIASSF